MYEFLNQLVVKSRFRSLTVLLPVSVPCHQIIELSRAVEEARIAKGNTDLLILCSAAINLILISLPLEISMSGQTNSTLYSQGCSWAEPSSRCGGSRLLPLYSSNWPILAQGTSPLVCFRSPSFCTSFTAAKDKNLTDLYKIVQTSRNIYCPFQHLLPG